MARIDNLTNFLSDVATAIKNKKGDNTNIKASDFDIEINNLSSGGSTPKVGFVVDEYDSDGYVTKVTFYGSSVPESAFFSQSSVLANYLTKNLTDVSFNDVVTSIGGSAFKNATNLINIGSIENLTSLDSYAFQNCSNLILKSVDKLGYFTQTSFSGCNSIVQLSMEGATMIAGNGTSSGAFYNCKGLKAVWIGPEITSIGRYSFSGCTNLTKIFIDLPRATVETWAGYSYAFMNKTDKTGIIVCNDDAGFITKEEFDSIDWSTR